MDLSERATAFPGGSWLTRQGLEDLIPDYGPKALNEVQKRKQEEVRRTQEVGKRKAIDFAPARKQDTDGGRSRYRAREADRDRNGDNARRRYHGHREDREGADHRRERERRDEHRSGWNERDMRRDKRDWDRRR